VFLLAALFEAEIAGKRIEGAAEMQQSRDKKPLDATRTNFQLKEERIH